MICPFLLLLFFSFASPKIEIDEIIKIKLYYSSSVLETINEVNVLTREFYILSQIPKNESQDNEIVLVHHEKKNDIFWKDINATLLYQCAIAPEDKVVKVWKAQIRWMSLGSEYPFKSMFVLAYKNNNVTFWDNNELHNYNLEENEGYYFMTDLNIKAHNITKYSEDNDTFILGDIYVRNIRFNKKIAVYYWFNEKDEKNSEAQRVNPTFLKNQNANGIEQWRFLIDNVNNSIAGIYLNLTYIIGNETYYDDNCGAIYNL